MNANDRERLLWNVTRMIVKGADDDAHVSVEVSKHSSHVVYSWPERQVVITTLVGKDGHVSMVREPFDFRPETGGAWWLNNLTSARTVVAGDT